jgi:hypothetical protein
MKQIELEQNGQLDILVNDIWGGDPLTEWDKPFWEHPLQRNHHSRKSVFTHMITSYYVAPLMV